MSKQRLRLAKYLGKRQFYRATFSEIRHDDHDQPQVLLMDVYPVYANGRKIPLRSRYTLTDKHGQQIAATHLWTRLNTNFLQVPIELLYGDIIQFSAIVETYPIVRDNVVQSRKQLWQQHNIMQQKIYQNYQDQAAALGKVCLLAKKKAYKSYKEHLLTFTEMKTAQEKAGLEFDKAKKKAYQVCQRKANRYTKKVQRQIANIKMLDYTLTDVDDVVIVKTNRHFNTDLRCQYNKTRLNDIRYTKFLAAHSMFARQGRLSEWSKGELV